MLAPSPNIVFSPPAPRADGYVVAGEDAPAWLAAAFAVAGTLVAMMSAALWQQAPAAPETVAAAAVPQMMIAQPVPKPQETPVPLPALTMAPPMPLPSATPVEPPAPPTSSTARAEPQSAAKAPAECFAPLAISFERGSTRPHPGDMKRALTVLQKALSRHGDAAILIEGHADASGSEDLNVLLSYSRAKAVAELLKKDGISPRMSVSAAGAGTARGDSEAAANDRKAVLRIAGVDDCDHLTEAKRP
ncbi:OmpA family protein [Bradyrhizobium sp. SRS-191]|uniref:OmpA family protein n=1 Tax=Bradyrhizobium sp. SRS-191 TaxID=2962606 RepID=UPI00211EE601|nr:OmpA family protein [Bradyrhizobium sp. SRS-191]